MAKHMVSAQLLSLGKVHESVCAASEIRSTRLRVYGQGTSHDMELGPRVQVGIKQASR